MALIHFLVFFGFCIACWWVIHWLLKRYVSSKPWHRWVRYAVWAGCIGLLTFDSIYYQVAVVHGMCEVDKKRIYPTPPASLVVGGPYTDEEVESIFKQQNRSYPTWMCIQQSTGIKGQCIVNGLVSSKNKVKLPFGGAVNEFILNNPITNETYYRMTNYEQEGQWLSRVIFGFGIIWTEQPKSCEVVHSKEQTILIN